MAHQTVTAAFKEADMLTQQMSANVVAMSTSISAMVANAIQDPGLRMQVENLCDQIRFQVSDLENNVNHSAEQFDCHYMGA